MSLSNDGKRWERVLNHIFDAYRNIGLMDVRHIDPPVRVVGGGKARQVIFQDNPWPDYVGCWRERSGRMLALEAKSTSENSLSVGKTGGVTARQWRALCDWSAAGAACGILWENPSGVFFVTLGSANEAIKAGKRLKPENGIRLQPGKGFVFFDVAAGLRLVY